MFTLSWSFLILLWLAMRCLERSDMRCDGRLEWICYWDGEEEAEVETSHSNTSLLLHTIYHRTDTDSCHDGDVITCPHFPGQLPNCQSRSQSSTSELSFNWICLIFFCCHVPMFHSYEAWELLKWIIFTCTTDIQAFDTIRVVEPTETRVSCAVDNVASVPARGTWQHDTTHDRRDRRDMTLPAAHCAARRLG